MLNCFGDECGRNRGGESRPVPVPFFHRHTEARFTLTPESCKMTWNYGEKMYECLFCQTLYKP